MSRVLSRTGHRSLSHVACATLGAMCHVATRLIWAECVLVTSESLTLGGKSWSRHTRLWRTMLCFPAVRADDRDIDHDISCKLAHEDLTASRWCAATWINVLIEKHAWLPAGLIWTPHASDSGANGSCADSKSDALESRPTINLFEQWEDGSHLCKLLTGCNYYFPTVHG